MEYPTLRNRLQHVIDNVGMRVNKVAENSGIDKQKLYNLRSGVQQTLTESDAIKLHEYLKQFETEEK